MVFSLLIVFSKKSIIARNSKHFSVLLPPKAATIVAIVQNEVCQNKKNAFAYDLERFFILLPPKAATLATMLKNEAV
jgi:hypothetical protein